MTETMREWARDAAAICDEFQKRRTKAGERKLTAIDTARRLMKERGSVIVAYGPGQDSYPAIGSEVPFFGAHLLPDGARLRIVEGTNVNAFTSQLVNIWGTEFSYRYPRPKGAKYFRCFLVEDESK